MKLKQLPLIGFCASLSLTISLFISNIAFIENQLTNEAKMGALCAAAFGMFGGIMYRLIYRLNKDDNITTILNSQFGEKLDDNTEMEKVLSDTDL